MPNGAEALVVFELIERNGHIVAKVIYAETIKADTIPTQKVCMLPGEQILSSVIPVKNYFSIFISPYFKDFTFLMSQLARAPSTF